MAMTLRLSEEETEPLRRLAEIQGRSMQDICREAVLSHVENNLRSELIKNAAAVTVPRYQEVLDRLAE